MNFFEWPSSTEAGFLFFPALLFIILFMIISIIKAVFFKRKIAPSTPLISLILTTGLIGYFFLGYVEAMQSHNDQIKLISKKIFKTESDRLKILYYSMVMMSRNFYSQISFDEPHRADRRRISEWKSCNNADDRTSGCYLYRISRNYLAPGEKKCSININQPFYIGKVKVAFKVDEYAKKRYSESDLIASKELITYCFYG